MSSLTFIIKNCSILKIWEDMIYDIWRIYDIYILLKGTVSNAAGYNIKELSLIPYFFK